MTSRRTFLFAGGGSGGHLFPGIAVAEELTARDADCRIVFAGSERGIERTILAVTDFSHVPLPVSPPGTILGRPFSFAAGFGKSVAKSLRLLDEFRPEAVIGLGGFASLPLGLAAWRRRVPLVLLEQNVVPGRATMCLSRLADRVCVSFEETASYLPRQTVVSVTGNPLRAAIRNFSNRTISRRAPSLLILGGSQGALGVNAMATAAMVSLRERLIDGTVVHQAGERDEATVKAAYHKAGIEAEVAAYFHDLPNRYAEADLAITRAGATTLAELACFGCPAIVVPYPGSIRDHQQRNAEHYRKAGGAEIVPEGPGAEKVLTSILDRLTTDAIRRSSMSRAMHATARIDATSQVADLLMPRSQVGVRAA